MNDSDEMKAAIYNAFLASAVAMGDRIKEISWFGKNQAKIEAMKKAA